MFPPFFFFSHRVQGLGEGSIRTYRPFFVLLGLLVPSCLSCVAWAEGSWRYGLIRALSAESLSFSCAIVLSCACGGGCVDQVLFVTFLPFFLYMFLCKYLSFFLLPTIVMVWIILISDLPPFVRHERYPRNLQTLFSRKPTMGRNK